MNKSTLFAAAIALPLLSGIALAGDAKLIDLRPVDPPIPIRMDLGTILHVTDGTVTTVYVANPDIADVMLKDGNDIFLFGKKAGVTVLYARDGDGDVVLRRMVQVNDGKMIVDVYHRDKKEVLSCTKTHCETLQKDQEPAPVYNINLSPPTMVQQQQTVIQNTPPAAGVRY